MPTPCRLERRGGVRGAAALLAAVLLALHVAGAAARCNVLGCAACDRERADFCVQCATGYRLVRPGACGERPWEQASSPSHAAPALWLARGVLRRARLFAGGPLAPAPRPPQPAPTAARAASPPCARARVPRPADCAPGFGATMDAALFQLPQKWPLPLSCQLPEVPMHLRDPLMPLCSCTK
jgi:hypothetical protein